MTAGRARPGLAVTLGGALLVAAMASAFGGRAARVYGQGVQAVTIWNGSKSGAQAAYARDRLDTLRPERPDLVLHSFGHNHSAGKVVGPVRALVSAVDHR